MTIMSKRGNLDNVVTYEHICDTTADMQKIDSKYITLGSTCIVISGDTGGMEVYLANSNKTWSPLGMISGGSGGGDGGGSNGSGITVIECECVEDEENYSFTLTNANLIAAALTDMEQNPTHLWNYGLYVHSTHGDLYGYGSIVAYTENHEPLYGFADLRGTSCIERKTSESGGETITQYHFNNSYFFTQDDIDENGTATLTPSGE